MCSLVHIGKENTRHWNGTILRGNPPENPYPHLNLMNVTATIHLFDSGILLFIIDLNKKKGGKRGGGGVNFICEFYI